MRKKRQEESLPEVPPRDSRMNAMAKVAKRFGSMKPAREVFTKVKSVPTRFVQYDRATRVGGHPIERVTLIHGPSNEGKAQPLEAKVLTPVGWEQIGDLRVGDLVIGSNGQACKVEGVFPQGRRPVFRVTFSDGSSTECCAEHLWKVKQAGRELVRSLAELLEDFEPGKYEIPELLPVHFEEQEVEPTLHPYLLGALLGDGEVAGASVRFHNPEADICERVRHLIPNGDTMVAAGDSAGLSYRIVKEKKTPHIFSATRAAVVEMGLWGKRSDSKFIPDNYLFGEKEERLALLRGLLDTDGSVQSGQSNIEYSTTSEKLADDVVFLVRSLGGLASLSAGIPSFTYKGERRQGKMAYRVRVHFQNGIIPVSSEKHLAKYKSDGKRRRRSIREVEEVRDKECVCIKVSAPDSLYVTDDFILTHNTAFCHGLEASFLERGHFASLVDAEFTTPHEWLVKLMADLADHPAFVGIRPDSYEQTVDAVRDFCTTIAEAREKKEVPPETSGLVVVDSIRKLVPQNIMAKILKEGASTAKGSVDGMGGRAAQIKAALNGAWMDELIPLLYRTQTALVLIARESEDTNADAMDKKFGNDYKVGGGKAIYFDSSLVVRITAKPIWEGPKGDAVQIGMRHCCVVKKTKVAAKDNEAYFFFHTSNGKVVPEGFDRARDVLELAKGYGILKVSGAWSSWRGKRWQGESRAVKSLTEKPEMLAEMEIDCRALFDADEEIAVPHDEDGVIFE